MQTLTYGLQRPDNGDKGSIFFPALYDNITQLDSHSHNGVNSPKLSTASITNSTQSIDKTNWAAVGDGTGRFAQNVTMPGGLDYDVNHIIFHNAASPYFLMHLDIEKVSTTVYKVYINDNTIDLTAVYL